MFAKVEKKVSDQEKTNKLCRYVKQKIGAVTLFLGQQFYQDFLILILSFRRKAQIHQKVWLSWLSIYKSLYSYSKHICNLYNRYYQYIILYSPHWTNSTTRWSCKFTLTEIMWEKILCQQQDLKPQLFDSLHLTRIQKANFIFTQLVSMKFWIWIGKVT